MKGKALYLPTALFVLAVALLSGCASVPMSGAEDDTRAKSFAAPPGKANIYVYRNEAMGAAVAMPVSLDGKMAGKTASKTYFLFQVDPGSYAVASHTENTATLQVNAEAGRNYFVWQEVKMGGLSAGSDLHLVSDATGKAGVMECKRIQSAGEERASPSPVAATPERAQNAPGSVASDADDELDDDQDCASENARCKKYDWAGRRSKRR
jgi:hypothetical protein